MKAGTYRELMQLLELDLPRRREAILHVKIVRELIISCHLTGFEFSI